MVHHFKCADYYCVPKRYTCDGKQDCPVGDDEHNCTDRLCQGLFRCRNSEKCLHFYDVSDDKMDCIEGDDEMFADLPGCPVDCECLMNALTCVNVLTIKLPEHSRFLYVLIMFSTPQLNLSKYLPDVIIFKVLSNNLQLFCMSSQAPQLFSVKYFDLSSNGIIHIGESCFNAASNLLELNLSSNSILSLKFSSFKMLTSVCHIDLANNRLEQINVTHFNSRVAHSIKKWVYMIDCASNFYPLSMEICAYFIPLFMHKHGEIWARICPLF